MNHRRFVCALDEEARRPLEGWWRTGRSHRGRERAHAVLPSAKGYTLDQIADVLDVDRDAVSRPLDRWEKGGVAALQEGPRPGRPPKVDAALEAEVLAAAAEQPAGVRRARAKRGRYNSPATTHESGFCLPPTPTPPAAHVSPPRSLRPPSMRPPCLPLPRSQVTLSPSLVPKLPLGNALIREVALRPPPNAPPATRHSPQAHRNPHNPPRLRTARDIYCGPYKWHAVFLTSPSTSNNSGTI